jgi:hypothetical protein
MPAEPQLMGPAWGWRKLGWVPEVPANPVQGVATSEMPGFVMPGCAPATWLSWLDDVRPEPEPAWKVTDRHGRIVFADWTRPDG